MRFPDPLVTFLGGLCIGFVAGTFFVLALRFDAVPWPPADTVIYKSDRLACDGRG